MVDGDRETGRSPRTTPQAVPDPAGPPGTRSMSSMCAGPRAELFHSLMARLGDRWTMVVIGVVGERRRRFGEIARLIPGISNRMLTVALRSLERDGLVSRTVYAEVPPRVEYELTALGRSLVGFAVALGGWVEAHEDEIGANRRAYDARTGTDGAPPVR